MSYYRPQVPDMVDGAIDTASKMYGLLNAPEDRRRKQAQEDMAMETARLQQNAAQLGLDKAQRETDDEINLQLVESGAWKLNNMIFAEDPEQAEHARLSFTNDEWTAMLKHPALGKYLGNYQTRMPGIIEFKQAMSNVLNGQDVQTVPGRDNKSWSLVGPGVQQMINSYQKIDPDRFSDTGEVDHAALYTRDGGQTYYLGFRYKDGSGAYREGVATKHRTKANDPEAANDPLSSITIAGTAKWLLTKASADTAILELKAMFGDKEARAELNKARANGLTKQQNTDSIEAFTKTAAYQKMMKGHHANMLQATIEAVKSGVLQKDAIGKVIELANTTKEKKYEIKTINRGTTVETWAINPADPSDRTLLGKGARWKDGAGGGADGSTALIKNAEFMVQRGIAKDFNQAFQMLNTAKDNPAALVKSLVTEGLKNNALLPAGQQKTPQQLVQEAREIVAGLQEIDQPAATAPTAFDQALILNPAPAPNAGPRRGLAPPKPSSQSQVNPASKFFR